MITTKKSMTAVVVDVRPAKCGRLPRQSRCKQSNQRFSLPSSSSSSGKFGNKVSSEWFCFDKTNDLADNRNALGDEFDRARTESFLEMVVVLDIEIVDEC